VSRSSLFIGLGMRGECFSLIPMGTVVDVIRLKLVPNLIALHNSTLLSCDLCRSVSTVLVYVLSRRCNISW
jgi:hypothetical protein